MQVPRDIRCSALLILSIDIDVHQFDAHEIPFDGPRGIVTLVEDLLATAPGLKETTRQKILDKFVRIILQQA